MTQGDYDRLVALAKVTGKLPAVVVRNIVIEYLDAHAKDIDEAQKAAATYQAALQSLNTRTFSLFEEESEKK